MKGRLGDNLMFGHKKIFLMGDILVWRLVFGRRFSVYRKDLQGSILFSVARGFQGIGPSLIVPNALAVAGRASKERRRTLVLLVLGGCSRRCDTLWSLQCNLRTIVVLAMDILDNGNLLPRVCCHEFPHFTCRPRLTSQVR